MASSLPLASSSLPLDPPALRQPLRDRLLTLSYPAFSLCVERLLLAIGYEELFAPGRLASRKRNSHGGYDLEGFLHNGLIRQRALVQIKQYDRPVPRAFVDELRGALVRRHADHGLLISISAFSPAAVAAARASWPIPVRLIAGEELLTLLLTHHIGIRPHPHTTDRWELDEAFFVGLSPCGEQSERVEGTPAVKVRNATNLPNAEKQSRSSASVSSSADLTITVSFASPADQSSSSMRPRP